MTKQYDLDKEDLIRLVYGLGGPRDPFDQRYKMYGELTGFPNEKWHWNNKVLKSLPEWKLWDLYQEMKEERINKTQ